MSPVVTYFSGSMQMAQKASFGSFLCFLYISSSAFRIGWHAGNFTDQKTSTEVLPADSSGEMGLPARSTIFKSGTFLIQQLANVGRSEKIDHLGTFGHFELERLRIDISIELRAGEIDHDREAFDRGVLAETAAAGSRWAGECGGGRRSPRRSRTWRRRRDRTFSLDSSCVRRFRPVAATPGSRGPAAALPAVRCQTGRRFAAAACS